MQRYNTAFEALKDVKAPVKAVMAEKHEPKIGCAGSAC
jgi:hypothetical protein